MRALPLLKARALRPAIPDTPGQLLLQVARALDRFRQWCEASGLGWPSLEQECVAREVQESET